MYVELLNYYGRHSFKPSEILEQEIAKRVSAGMSREEAIANLYREVFGASTQPSEKRGVSLEEALESLMTAKREDYSTLAALIVWLVAILVTVASAGSHQGYGVIQGYAAILVLLALLGLALTVRLQSGKKGKWVWREVLSIEGAGDRWMDVMRQVPKIYQKLALQNVESETIDDKLILRMNLETMVTVRYESGSQTLPADLGPFTVEATFRNIGGTLFVEAVYEGRPPVTYASYAAQAYEQAIAAFRAAVEEAYEATKPKTLVLIDFEKLEQLLASKGVVVTAVRCPYCGGSVQLPKEGDTTKCSYCGTTLRAVDIYKALKEIVKGLE